MLQQSATEGLEVPVKKCFVKKEDNAAHSALVHDVRDYMHYFF